MSGVLNLEHIVNLAEAQIIYNILICEAEPETALPSILDTSKAGNISGHKNL